MREAVGTSETFASRAHQPSRVELGLTEGTARWVAGFVLVLALHAGLAAYLVSAARQALEGAPSDAISVELMPDFEQQNAKPDDVAGPKAAGSPAPTSDNGLADDPNPPAPDAPPPSEAKRKPDAAPEPAPPPTRDAQAELQAQEKHEDRPPDPKPPVETPAKPDLIERPVAPSSQASGGSAALLGGGRRPSAAAQKTWRGDIGSHLVKHRRYPQEARSRGWQGIARVRVTIDGNGHILGRELVKSTGRSILDDEALQLMQRSDPFPKPPAGMPAPIVMTVPVNFNIH